MSIGIFIPHPHRRPRGTCVGYPSIVAANPLVFIHINHHGIVKRTPRLLLSQTLSMTLLKPLYHDKHLVPVGPK